MTSRHQKRGRSSSRSAHADRKVYQLCAQAQRALSYALAESEEPELADLHILAVQPCPNAARLLVVLQPAMEAAIDTGGIKDALDRDKGRLRLAVTHSIHRKRTPTLLFEVLPSGLVEVRWED